MMFSTNFVSRIATMTNEDVSILPRIHIPNQSILFQLMVWRNRNKDLVRNFNSIVNEGIISVEVKENFQYFKQEGKKIFHMNKATPKEYIAFAYDTETWEVTPIKSTITFYSEESATQDMITVHATVMAYLNHIGVTEIDEGEVITIDRVVM